MLELVLEYWVIYCSVCKISDTQGMIIKLSCIEQAALVYIYSG
jgi:hypothetical protein